MCLAVPGQIKEIVVEDELARTGKVDFNGIIKEVNLSYVPEAKVGEFVIVHVGFAISVVDEEEAHETLRYFEELNELQDLMEKDE